MVRELRRRSTLSRRPPPRRSRLRLRRASLRQTPNRSPYPPVHSCDAPLVGTVVEFCGLPGSGKSTIARALVASLRLQGVPTSEVMAPIGPSATARPSAQGRSHRAGGLTSRGSMTVATDVGLRSGQADARDRIARPANLLVVRARGPTRPPRGRGVTSSTRDRSRSGGRRPCAPTPPGCFAWAAADPAQRVRSAGPRRCPVRRLERRLERRRDAGRVASRASPGPALGGTASGDQRCWMRCATNWYILPERIDPSSFGSTGSIPPRWTASGRSLVGLG